jgi:hypothetical protein
MQTYTDDQMRKIVRDISALTQLDCARLLRFAEVGHPYFRSDLPLNDIFNAHFKIMGGMTPEISKFIGWEK